MNSVNDRKAIVIAMLASLMIHTTIFYFAAVLFSRHVWMSPDEVWSSNFQPIETRVEIPEPPLPILPPDMDQLGEAEGTGTALDTIVYPEPQQSNLIGVEQAALTQAIPIQRNVTDAGSASLGPARKRQQLKPTSLFKPDEHPGENRQVETGINQSSNQLEASDSQQAEGADTGQSEADQSQNLSEQSRRIQSNPVQSSGPEFHASDQDSDPFSADQAYEFRPGGTRARGGRDVKMRRPHVDLQFRADVTRLGTPFGVLTEITIDKDSKPTNVVIIKSSGSQAIDDSVRLALFQSTFGQPAPATFRFGVLFY